MTWTEIENKAIGEFLNLIEAAGFVNGDAPTKQKTSGSGIPFFRGFNDNLNSQKSDHCTFDVVPVNDTIYSDDDKNSVYVTIGIDYITSSKWSLQKVTDTRMQIENAFAGTDWLVYNSGHSYDSASGRNVFSYDVRKVF